MGVKLVRHLLNLMGAKMGEEMKQQDTKCVTLTPWHRIQEQINHLDRSLNTIKYDVPVEVRLARTFIIAQIEALKWAARLLEI